MPFVPVALLASLGSRWPRPAVRARAGGRGRVGQRPRCSRCWAPTGRRAWSRWPGRRATRSRPRARSSRRRPGCRQAVTPSPAAVRRCRLHRGPAPGRGIARHRADASRAGVTPGIAGSGSSPRVRRCSGSSPRVSTTAQRSSPRVSTASGVEPPAGQHGAAGRVQLVSTAAAELRAPAGQHLAQGLHRRQRQSIPIRVWKATALRVGAPRGRRSRRLVVFAGPDPAGDRGVTDVDAAVGAAPRGASGRRRPRRRRRSRRRRATGRG